MALSVALCLIMNINIGSIAQRVREAFRRPRGPPATASFANSTSLARVSLLVRVALIFRLLPSDVGLWIQSPALASVTANPIFTLDQVREAAAIRRLTAPHKFANSYAGRQTHLPVLLLACLEPLTDAITSEYWQHILTGLLLLVVDFIIARLLMQLGEAIVRLSAKHGGREASLQRKMPKVIRPALSHIFPISKTSTDTANGPLLWMLDLPGVAAHLYFASPVTALSSGAFDCFQNVRVMLILYAIVKSYTSVQENGSCVAIAFALALAVYVDVHSVAFVVPAALFLYSKRGRPATMLLLQLFVVLSVCLQGLSLLLVGSADYASIISTTHGHAFTLTGVAPSLSVLWYIAMEMFERFTGYFTILLGGLPYLLIAPASVRLYRYPAELVRLRPQLGFLLTSSFRLVSNTFLRRPSHITGYHLLVALDHL